ncbi:hypothetical protein NQU17_13040 [Clostridiaceae bacterium HFYG-1003]|nr:hypothetical protein NQU17_13040 [Clostridiaceae bacterium HFYG-1003]
MKPEKDQRELKLSSSALNRVTVIRRTKEEPSAARLKGKQHE